MNKANKVFDWKDEYFEIIQGAKTPMITWSEQVYFYLGLAGTWRE